MALILYRQIMIKFIFQILCIEKYTRGVSAVESILVLDRLRQSVAVKELETQQSKQQLSMRKTASVPNFSQVMFHFSIFIHTFKRFLIVAHSVNLCAFHAKNNHIHLWMFYIIFLTNFLIFTINAH
jgi:glutaredoxin 2